VLRQNCSGQTVIFKLIVALFVPFTEKLSVDDYDRKNLNQKQEIVAWAIWCLELF
jgi:hypothetical protein